MYCKNCGVMTSGKSKICYSCGAGINGELVDGEIRRKRKKTGKWKVIIPFAVIALMVYFIANAPNADGEVLGNNEKKDDAHSRQEVISLKEDIDSPGVHVWMWDAGSEVAKDDAPKNFFVFENGKVSYYAVKNGPVLTYGDMSGMSEEEIADFVRDNYPGTSALEGMSSNYSLTGNYFIHIETDSTGNATVYEELVCEAIEESTGRAGYFLSPWGNYYAHAWGGDQLGIWQVYDSFFGGYKNYDEYMLITKCEADTQFVFDPPGAPGISVD